MVNPGVTVQIVDNTIVSARPLGTNERVNLSINGWMAMRPDDFNKLIDEYLTLKAGGSK